MGREVAVKIRDSICRDLYGSLDSALFTSVGIRLTFAVILVTYKSTISADQDGLMAILAILVWFEVALELSDRAFLWRN